MLQLAAFACCSTTLPPATPLRAAVSQVMPTACPQAIPNEYIVRLRSVEDVVPFRNSVDALFADEAPITRDESLPHSEVLFGTLLLVRLPPQDRSFLDRNERVLYYEPNAKVTFFKTPSDGDFNAQCGLKTIHAEAAWDKADPEKADGVTIAIVDTGVYKHTDLPSMAQRDDDTTGTGHGTQLAGIIGAVQGNGGIVGVIWKASMSAYAFNGELAYGLGKLEAALKTSPNIVLMSWGTRCKSKTLEDDISNNSAVLFVAAASNDGVDMNRSAPVYPAVLRYPNLISVMATKCEDDSVPRFSSYGKGLIDIAAPGTSDVNGTCDRHCPQGILTTVLNDRYCCEEGTSMSAAFVAGAAALVWSHQSSPSAASVRKCLMASAAATQTLSAFCDSGRLDLLRAVDGTVDGCK